MNLFLYLHEVVATELAALSAAGEAPRGLPPVRFAVEPPRDPTHGDVSTNAAMVLAKPTGMQPRALAQALAMRLGRRPEVTEATVAGPGFINLRLSQAFWHARLADVLREGA